MTDRFDRPARARLQAEIDSLRIHWTAAERRAIDAMGLLRQALAELHGYRSACGCGSNECAKCHRVQRIAVASRAIFAE